MRAVDPSSRPEGWSAGAKVLVVWNYTFRFLPFLYVFAVGVPVGGLGFDFELCIGFVGCRPALRGTGLLLYIIIITVLPYWA